MSPTSRQRAGIGPDILCSVAAFLANQGRKVSVVFEKADAVIASKTPVPEFVRKSRCASRTASTDPAYPPLQTDVRHLSTCRTQHRPRVRAILGPAIWQLTCIPWQAFLAWHMGRQQGYPRHLECAGEYLCTSAV